MFVMATSGTTVLGAFDQLDLLADVCEKHNLWLHCDVRITIYKQNICVVFVEYL